MSSLFSSYGSEAESVVTSGVDSGAAKELMDEVGTAGISTAIGGAKDATKAISETILEIVSKLL